MGVCKVGEGTKAETVAANKTNIELYKQGLTLAEVASKHSESLRRALLAIERFQFAAEC